MVKAPAKDTGPGKPRIFLVLAALMAVIAGLAYFFEDELYFMRPVNPYVPSFLNTYFIGILIFSVIFALFFLYCYKVPKFGNKLLGRAVYPPRERRTSEATVTYNVFADTTPSAVKYAHRRRKLARHERHMYVKRSKPKSKKKS